MSERHRRRAAGIVEVLAVVLIILILIAFLLPRTTGGKSDQVQKGVAAVAEARDNVCRTNLTLLRQAISVQKATGQNLANLSDLKQTSVETHCAAGGEEYTYNSSTGEVKCPHPGHESY